MNNIDWFTFAFGQIFGILEAAIVIIIFFYYELKRKKREEKMKNEKIIKKSCYFCNSTFYPGEGTRYYCGHPDIKKCGLDSLDCLSCSEIPCMKCKYYISGVEAYNLLVNKSKKEEG